MKNKKGFTLVELLIVIVIMTGILGLAIVSVNEISTKQKIKAKERVEEQIIVAAKAYFKDNEYFLRSIASSFEEEGYITLGTLVKLDYLNAVTDPTTNKKMDLCSYVKVTPDGYKFMGTEQDVNDLKSKIKEENGGIVASCDMEGPKIGIVTPQKTTTTEPTTTRTTTTTPESIIFDVELYNKKYKTTCAAGTLKETFAFNDANKTETLTSSWLHSKSGVDNGVFIQIKPQKAPEGTKIYFSEVLNETTGVKEGLIGTDTTTYCFTYDAIYNIKLKNTFNSDVYTLKVKLDRKAPTIEVKNVPKDWTSADEVALEITTTDGVSGVESKKRYWNEKGLTKADANSAKYAWDEEKLKYYGGSSKAVSVSNAIENAVYSSQGYRKGIVKACDKAGNCDFSEEYVIKIDKTVPSVAKVTIKVDGWTNKSVDYDIKMEDELSGVKYYIAETNKRNLTYSQSRSDEYKWNKETEKYTNGYTNKYTNDDKGFGNKYETTGTFSKKNQGRRLIKIKVCDYAGLCTISDGAVAQIDTEPPEVIDAGSGYVHCLKVDSTNSYNAHGYSIKIKDNLSGATLKIKEYYSSWDCGDTAEFDWAKSTNVGISTSQNSEGQYTAFVGCTNNPNPAMRFTIEDAAGNKYKNSNGDYYYGVNHSEGSISSSNKKQCDATKWYNRSPNR